MYELVGRSEELHQIRSALKEALTESGTCIVVEGQAGIGKSCLLAAAVREAVELGMAVAAGRAAELDRAAPLTTLLCALRDENAPGLVPADLTMFDAQRLGTVDLLAERIAKYAGQRGLLIALDDAHLADEFTALALRLLVPALSSARVLWLITRKPMSGRGVVQEAIDHLIDESARLLQLEPFDSNAVVRFCTIVLGAEPDGDLLSMAARTGGDPSLLADLLTGLRETDRIYVADGRAHLRLGDLPPTFLTSVDRRLHDLSIEARHLLDTASVFDRPFTVHEVAILQNRPAIELFPAVREAVQAGVLLEYSAQLVFQHDLIREAIHQQLAVPLRVTLHREMVPLLTAAQRDPGEVARHLVRGDWSGEDLVKRLSEMVANHGAARPQLFIDIVRMLIAFGFLNEARHLVDFHLDDLDALEQGLILLELAEAATLTGQDINLVGTTNRALNQHGVSEPVRARLLGAHAHGLLHTDIISAADIVGAEAAALGLRAHEPDAQVMGAMARSAAAGAEGRLADAVRYAQEAASVAESAGGRHQPRLWLARALITLDRFDEAEAVIERIDTGELGSSQTLWQYTRAIVRMAAGRLHEAAIELNTIPSAQRHHACHARPLALLGHIALLRGDMRTARHHLRLAEQLAALNDGWTPEVSWRIALLHHIDGSSQQALTTAEAVYEALTRRPLFLIEEPQAAVDLTRIALRAGATEQAEVAVDAIRRLLERNPGVPSIAGAAAHAEGLLRDDLLTMRAAVDAYRASPRLLAKAMAMEDAAEAEAAQGNRAKAIRLWQEALEHYTLAGAVRETSRLSEALSATPMASGRIRRNGSSHVNGWNSLTEAELRVVSLVADGLTNREVASRLFLSPHTVDSHLRSSFAKLGVSSRVQLTKQFILHKRDIPEKT